MSEFSSNLVRWFWWIWHFPWRCGADIKTERGAWNPDHPDYVTPRHQCRKCGRQYTAGKVYPSRPWPKCPPRDSSANV